MSRVGVRMSEWGRERERGVPTLKASILLQREEREDSVFWGQVTSGAPFYSPSVKLYSVILKPERAKKYTFRCNIIPFRQLLFIQYFYCIKCIECSGLNLIFLHFYR